MPKASTEDGSADSKINRAGRQQCYQVCLTASLQLLCSMDLGLCGTVRVQHHVLSL